MNRYEFIEKLRRALTGQATQSVINDNVRYYEEYLDIEISKGRNEEEVLRSLGDPRLLAKTIIEANKQAGYSSYGDEIIEDGPQFEEKAKKGSGVNVNGKNYVFPAWAAILVTVLAVILVFAIIGSVLSILIPILLPLFLIIMAVQVVTVLLRRK